MCGEALPWAVKNGDHIDQKRMWYVNLHSFPVPQLSLQAHIKHRECFSWTPSKSARHSCTGLKWLQSTEPVPMSWKPHKVRVRRLLTAFCRTAKKHGAFIDVWKTDALNSLRTATASTKQLYQNTLVIFCLGTSLLSPHFTVTACLYLAFHCRLKFTSVFILRAYPFSSFRISYSE